MISGESGALVLLNNPYPRCVSEPDTYIDATYFEESTVTTPAVKPSLFAVRAMCNLCVCVCGEDVICVCGEDVICVCGKDVICVCGEDVTCAW